MKRINNARLSASNFTRSLPASGTGACFPPSINFGRAGGGGIRLFELCARPRPQWNRKKDGRGSRRGSRTSNNKSVRWKNIKFMPYNVNITSISFAVISNRGGASNALPWNNIYFHRRRSLLLDSGPCRKPLLRLLHLPHRRSIIAAAASSDGRPSFA